MTTRVLALVLTCALSAGALADETLKPQWTWNSEAGRKVKLHESQLAGNTLVLTLEVTSRYRVVGIDRTTGKKLWFVPGVRVAHLARDRALLVAVARGDSGAKWVETASGKVIWETQAATPKWLFNGDDLWIVEGLNTKGELRRITAKGKVTAVPTAQLLGLRGPAPKIRIQALHVQERKLLVIAGILEERASMSKDQLYAHVDPKTARVSKRFAQFAKGYGHYWTLHEGQAGPLGLVLRHNTAKKGVWAVVGFHRGKPGRPYKVNKWGDDEVYQYTGRARFAAGRCIWQAGLHFALVFKDTFTGSPKHVPSAGTLYLTEKIAVLRTVAKATSKPDGGVQIVELPSLKPLKTIPVGLEPARYYRLAHTHYNASPMLRIGDALFGHEGTNLVKMKLETGEIERKPARSKGHAYGQRFRVGGQFIVVNVAYVGMDIYRATDLSHAGRLPGKHGALSVTADGEALYVATLAESGEREGCIAIQRIPIPAR